MGRGSPVIPTTYSPNPFNFNNLRLPSQKVPCQDVDRKNLRQMATEKNLLPDETGINEYIPPRLVKAQQGWYVVYYHLVAGMWTRERKTFNLNRIRERARRLERAREIIAELDGSLQTALQGGGSAAELNALARTPVVEGIDFAVGIICQSPKQETRTLAAATRSGRCSAPTSGSGEANRIGSSPLLTARVSATRSSSVRPPWKASGTPAGSGCSARSASWRYRAS